MIKLHHCKNEELFPDILNELLDIVCVDPPYKYLKNQKLEVDFDEQLFFENCKRVLKKDGFIILFGRGTSFYRWNVILENLGFTFKEEIIWDKSYTSSPLNAISRIHETVAIWTKGKGKIQKIKVPYIEMKGHDLSSIIADIKRLKSAFSNTNNLNAVLSYLGIIDKVKTSEYKKEKHSSTIQPSKIIYDSERKDKIAGTARKGLLNENRTAAVFRQISEGSNEKTIIKSIRDHYTAIHPTQKPVRLLERLIQLVLPKSGRVIIADFFGGSFSTMEAVINLQKTYPDLDLEGVSCEMDQEYFDLGKKRIDEILNNQNKQLQLL